MSFNEDNMTIKPVKNVALVEENILDETPFDSQLNVAASENATPKKPSWRAKYSYLCSDWWLIEIICWLSSAICLGSIASLLLYYDSREMPARFPLGLNLNAYISVLSAVTKLALAVPLEQALAAQKYIWFSTKTPEHSLIDFERFDEAVRGLVGALRLIWCTRTRSIASLGGTIIILSLALDPFFQQLVSYPSRPSLINRGRTPRLVKFQRTGRLVTAGSDDAISPDETLHDVIPGFFHPNWTALPLTPFCPSETCAWPNFETLGVCGECRDISSWLTFDCLVESGDWRSTYDPNDPKLNETTGKSCGWFFNASSPNPMLMTGYTVDSGGIYHVNEGALLTRHLNLHDPQANYPYWNGTFVLKDIPTPLASWAVVSSTDLQSTYRNETPGAYACALRWCTKTISASFAHGVYKEAIISVFKNDTITPDPILMEPKPDGTQDWYYLQNITITPPGSRDTFWVDNRTMLGARFAFDSWIPNTLLLENNSMPLIDYYPLPDVVGGPLGETTFSTDWMRKGEPPVIVDRMATDLTTVLRNSREYGEAVLGSGVYETFIKVDWAFFSFPLIVFTATLAFLVTTIFQTSKACVWKTSTLTTLLHGLSPEAKEELKNAISMHELRAEAKKVRVYLNSNQEGRLLDVENGAGMKSERSSTTVT